MPLNQPGSPSELPPELMTAKETAEYLRTPLPTVYFLITNGTIPAVQIGGRWRVKRTLLNSRLLSPPTVVLKVGNKYKKKEVIDALRMRGKFNLELSNILDNSDPKQTFITSGSVADSVTPEYQGRIIRLIDNETIPEDLNRDIQMRPFAIMRWGDIADEKKGLRALLGLNNPA